EPSAVSSVQSGHRQPTKPRMCAIEHVKGSGHRFDDSDFVSGCPCPTAVRAARAYARADPPPVRGVSEADCARDRRGLGDRPAGPSVDAAQELCTWSLQIGIRAVDDLI